MEQILYRIKKYSEEALHYPVDTFQHKDAMRLLGLAIAEFQASQQLVKGFDASGKCTNCGNEISIKIFGI